MQQAKTTSTHLNHKAYGNTVEPGTSQMPHNDTYTRASHATAHLGLNAHEAIILCNNLVIYTRILIQITKIQKLPLSGKRPTHSRRISSNNGQTK